MFLILLGKLLKHFHSLLGVKDINIQIYQKIGF